MALALFILTLVDESGRVIKGKKRIIPIPRPAESYQRGSWKNA
jgi:hypothetical protein